MEEKLRFYEKAVKFQQQEYVTADDMQTLHATFLVFLNTQRVTSPSQHLFLRLIPKLAQVILLTQVARQLILELMLRKDEEQEHIVADILMSFQKM